jgi:hypothetical protein
LAELEQELPPLPTQPDWWAQAPQDPAAQYQHTLQIKRYFTQLVHEFCSRWRVGELLEQQIWLTLAFVRGDGLQMIAQEGYLPLSFSQFLPSGENDPALLYQQFAEAVIAPLHAQFLQELQECFQPVLVKPEEPFDPKSVLEQSRNKVSEYSPLFETRTRYKRRVIKQLAQVIDRYCKAVEQAYKQHGLPPLNDPQFRNLLIKKYRLRVYEQLYLRTVKKCAWGDIVDQMENRLSANVIRKRREPEGFLMPKKPSKAQERKIVQRSTISMAKILRIPLPESPKRGKRMGKRR